MVDKTPHGLIKSKTISSTDFRRQPGEYLMAVSRAGQSFTIEKSGKPVARLVPLDSTTTILPDGTIVGDLPLTRRLEL